MLKLIFQIMQQKQILKYFTCWYFRFYIKKNLANLKTEVNKLDIDKLEPVPVDLSKLSDVVKNDVVKKDAYDKLVTKVNAIQLNNIDTGKFVLKSKYDTDKSELVNKIPNTGGLVKKADYDSNISEINGKILNVTNLASKTALTTVETALTTDTKVTEIENKLNKS